MAEVGVGGVVEVVEVEGGLETVRVRRSVKGGFRGGDGDDGGGAVGVSSAVFAVPIGRTRHGAPQGGSGRSAWVSEAAVDWGRSKHVSGGGGGGVHVEEPVLGAHSDSAYFTLLYARDRDWRRGKCYSTSTQFHSLN